MGRSFPLPMGKQFSDYHIVFGQGTKNDDDYIIYINEKQVTDEEIFKCINRYSQNRQDAIALLRFIWEISQEDDVLKEEDIFEKIENSDYEDELKVFLFAIWHRLIIDDINYPISEGLNGRRRLLGQIYLLIGKKFSFELPSYILSLPKEIFRLGFPNGITEKISTKQWNEIYDLYRRFYEGKKECPRIKD